MAARQRWHGIQKKEAEHLFGLFVYTVACVLVCCVLLHNSSSRTHEMLPCVCVCLCVIHTLSVRHIFFFILFSFFARFCIFRVRICSHSCFLFSSFQPSHSHRWQTHATITLLWFIIYWQTLAWIRFLSFITKENLITFGREIVVCMFCFSFGFVFILFCVLVSLCCVRRAQISRVVDTFSTNQNEASFWIITIRRVKTCNLTQFIHFIWQ